MTTQSGETQHGEERRGGFREAVNELFGRGERDADDRAREHNVTTSRDGEYADERVGAHETSPQAEYRSDEYGEPGAATQSAPQSRYRGDVPGDVDGQQTGFGHETRGDTVSAEDVRHGGDPTAHGAVQHGDEYRGDPNLPGQAQYGGPTEHGGGQAQWGAAAPDTTHGAADNTYDEADGATRADHRADHRADDDLADRADDDLTARVDHGADHGTDHGVGRTADDRADRTTAEGWSGSESETRADKRTVSADPVQADHGAAPDPASTSGYRDPDTQPSTTAASTSAAGAGSAAASSSLSNLPDPDQGEQAALVTRERADSYSSRWDHVKGEFVDEPRKAVRNADALVGELLDELQGLFKSQRSEIERGLDNDETSTEDLRVALRRYRSFFDRLLSI